MLHMSILLFHTLLYDCSQCRRPVFYHYSMHSLIQGTDLIYLHLHRILKQQWHSSVAADVYFQSVCSCKLYGRV